MGGESFLDLRLGLVAHSDGINPLGEENRRVPRQVEITPTYINTVCLPRNEHQFRSHDETCWVAAWGQDLKRQREVDLPLVTKSQCERRLRPIFEETGVYNPVRSVLVAFAIKTLAEEKEELLWSVMIRDLTSILLSVLSAMVLAATTPVLLCTPT